MQNIYESVSKLYDDIVNETDFYKHRNLIITGSNAIGKTQLIKDILKKSLEEAADIFYYIDPKNRIMVDRDNNILVKKLSELPTREILEHRLKDGVFTVLDEFAQQNSGGAVAFDELLENIEMYNNMYQKFFGFSVEKVTTIDYFLTRQMVIVNGKTNLTMISNSEAAKMRILMEVNYAVNRGIKAIVIDEFDAYFSEESILDFMNKLIENYPDTRFLFVIHSLSVIVSVEEVDVALINNMHQDDVRENLVYFFDADNIEQIGQIEKIRNVMVNIEHRDEKWWEERVAMIVDGKNLDEVDLKKIKETVRSDLKAKEKILYDFIVRNIGEK
ncbi:MAG: hypothetical protein HFG69_16135 [Hungatella sp.]|nr:hypothetical protein [Hungatella sp.]